MGWVLEVLFGICLIILCSGLVNYLGIRARKGYPEVERKKIDDESMDMLYARLDTLEQRMTDVQDVMIALSEKFDRWDEERERV
jgi:hypothetical protein